MDKPSYVYMLASAPYGTLYIGVTTNIIRRVWEHKNDVVESFTQKYGVHLLVWYEIHGSLHEAIAREKHLKKWKRSWKVDLISEHNPRWRDLYLDFTA
ncbi:MAG: GIY-YIG nuclease family protein [Pseudomonadota bacterium]